VLANLAPAPALLALDPDPDQLPET
jgi:hypothetical protein